MKRFLQYDNLFDALDPATRYALLDDAGTGTEGGGGAAVTPEAARTYLADYGHGADGLKAMADPDVLKLHGTVNAALDKHRPAPADWHTGITDAALKPVAERYKTPEEAIRALATPQDWRSGVTDENLKKIAEPYKTPADALKALADKSSDWRSTITDPDLVEHAKRFNSAADLVKANVDQRKQLSTAIVRPGKDAKPEEIAAYRKALDIPEAPTGYEFARPAHIAEEEFKSDHVQGVVKAFAEIAHAAGIPKAGAAALFDWYGNVEAATLKAQSDNDVRFAEESTTALKAKWGKDYDANIAYANRATDKLFGANIEGARKIADKSDRLVLDNPVFLEAFAAIGREMGEGTLGSTLSEGERSTINDQIADVRKRRAEASAKGDSKIANELYNQEQKLYEKRDGNQSIVGRAA